MLSVTLALLTYGLSRGYLLSRRESLATQQAVVDARAVSRVLPDSSVDRPALLASLSNAGESRSLLRVGGQWFAADGSVDRNAIPPPLRSWQGTRTARQVVDIAGSPGIVVAVPIGPDVGVFYQVFYLTELRGTLRALAIALAIAAAITTLSGALLGRFASRRVLRPLDAMATAAASIAGGSETRLVTRDPDLAPFTDSFNNMVDALEDRIEREARFASDVSHELRTPLAAIGAAVEVLDRRVGDDARPALDILSRQTRRFERLVLDLLEISRIHAGSATVERAPADPAQLVRQALRQAGHGDVPVVVDPSAPASVIVDRRRIERVLANLVDNAEHYGGGATLVSVAGSAGAVQIAVDDAGPGIDAAQREHVFERFHRGATSRSSSAPGTGLGLAIASEDCRLHGGQLAVTDSPAGGARFVITLPLGPP